MIGKGSYGYNRSLLKSCADYSRYRKMTTLREMHNWNSQSTSNQLPKNVINEANNMFALIKDHGYVFRKDVKKGVQGACLYYTCHQNGISKTPFEIAKIVGIAEKFLSSGDRILSDLNERGIIQIPKIDSIPSYINRYFELLNIPVKYKQFVLDIIEQADNDKLHVLYDSKNNTKCIGAIYMLIERVIKLRKTISKELIEKECGISKTTFIKYYVMLCKYYRRFVFIFIKHKIPMKSQWNETISENPELKYIKLPKLPKLPKLENNKLKNKKPKLENNKLKNKKPKLPKLPKLENNKIETNQLEDIDQSIELNQLEDIPVEVIELLNYKIKSYKKI
jgi:transcription initiation factor TFIIIB Brf1 subunit/transcription initiation factor TFIIB